MQTYKASVPKKPKHRNRHLHAALRDFWQRTGRRETHLVLLREFAQIRLGNAMVLTTHKYRARRKTSAAGIIKVQHYRCFVCPNQATCGHHIIQLQHGGTNAPYNLVPVCETCHADIHPWMPTNEAPDARPIWG